MTLLPQHTELFSPLAAHRKLPKTSSCLEEVRGEVTEPFGVRMLRAPDEIPQGKAGS